MRDSDSRSLARRRAMSSVLALLWAVAAGACDSAPPGSGDNLSAADSSSGDAAADDSSWVDGSPPDSASGDADSVDDLLDGADTWSDWGPFEWVEIAAGDLSPPLPDDAQAPEWPVCDHGIDCDCVGVDFCTFARSGTFVVGTVRKVIRVDEPIWAYPTSVPEQVVANSCPGGLRAVHDVVFDLHWTSDPEQVSAGSSITVRRGGTEWFFWCGEGAEVPAERFRVGDTWVMSLNHASAFDVWLVAQIPFGLRRGTDGISRVFVGPTQCCELPNNMHNHAPWSNFVHNLNLCLEHGPRVEIDAYDFSRDFAVGYSHWRSRPTCGAIRADPTQCSVHAQCAEGETCFAGRCHSVVCNDDVDCPGVDARCVSGVYCGREAGSWFDENFGPPQ